jgi:hypothetical protein
MTNSPEYNKQYYETHKETYQKKYNAKKRCNVCDKWISGSNFADHLKTATHHHNAQNDMVKNELDTNKLDTNKLDPNKLDPNLERIAITCGDAGENHQGMEMKGKLGDVGSGFTIDELMKIKKYVENVDKKCDFIDLSHPTAIDEKSVKKEAGVLILRNFLNENKVEKVYKDLISVEWDTKY